MAKQHLQYPHGYALFIGLQYSHWGHRLKPLNGAINDVKDLYKHFTNTEKAGFKSEQITCLEEERATKKAIIGALEKLAEKVRKDKNAMVWIYFSGHGVSDGANHFLLPYDFKIAQWLEEGRIDRRHTLLSQEFSEKLNAICAKKCLIILDCCHAENIPVNRGPGVQTPFLDAFAGDLEKRLDQIPVTRNVSREIGEGTGRVILTSCKANEAALDLGRNGLFTQILLECLNGKENIKNDGWVRLTDMMDYIPKTVKARAWEYYDHHQSPMFKLISGLGAEDFIICAYDISQTKGLWKANDPKPKYNTNNFSKIHNLIDKSNFDQVFKLLDQIPLESTFQYNRLKAEYTAGIKGIDLVDFTKRLKVFVNQISKY